MTSLLLGGATFVVGLHNGPTVALMTMATIGTGVVLAVGLLGRAVAGPWIGLTAAGLAAVAPNLWMPSGILMSETPTMLFTALLLLAVVHLLARPTVVSAALAGAACGAVALSRAELIAFVPTLLVPAVLGARRVPVGRRLRLLGVGLVATVVVVGPWVGRNLVSFQDPTTISTGNGLALLGANCPQTYWGPDLGSWSLQCATSVTGPGDESVQAARKEHAALQFMGHHPGRLPVVVLARIGREWDVYQPAQMTGIEANEGRLAAASWAGLVVYWALLPLGVAGVVLLRRRRIAQWFLLVPAGVVTVVAALFYGLVRFRAPFEVCLVVLASPPLVLAGRSVADRLTGRTRVAPTGSPPAVQ
jgi:4-amino-4-deoxy-L-arabinose transferase-like glycosyltransferase